MEISRFGNTHAMLYTLENEAGMKVSVTNYGALLLQVLVPDRNGKKVDVVLGFDGPEGYMEKDTTFGASVGRVANRVAGGHFELNGTGYQMDINNGPNCLHGGFDKYYRRYWYAEADEDLNSVSFYLNSPDGDQGMPGNADICVSYSLDDSGSLRIDYYAVSDKDTYFNLTNHSYFNLNGAGKGTIEDHLLRLDADRYTEVGEDLIPTGRLIDVEGTAFDFRTEKPVGRDMYAQEQQLRICGGYDHNFVINRPSLMHPFARVTGPETGITMEVYTDLPGVQLYTGNFLGKPDDLPGKSGIVYPKHGALCLETQFFPDSPNHPEFPSAFFAAGEEFIYTTVFQFGTV